MTLHTLSVQLIILSMTLSGIPQATAQQRGSDIAAGIVALGDRDPASRWASAKALARLGAVAVPALAEALGNRDENVRTYSALALAELGPPAKDALPQLISALKDPSIRVRENAARALGNLGPAASQAVEPLLACLSDPDPYVNGQSAEALSRIGRASVPGLLTALTSTNATARWCATIALGKIGPDAFPAVSPLSAGLRDQSENVRWGSAVALGNIGPAARPAIPALLAALSDRDQDVRTGATLALEQIEPSAVEAHLDRNSVSALIDTLVPLLMKETRVPGVAIALISNRTVVWSRQYGVADARSGVPVTRGTLFEACSMSKPLFGYLAMKLVEDGKLNLEAPLATYLEPSSLRGQPHHADITGRMALSHTTGLPNWRKAEEEQDGPLAVAFTPGSKFGYSGEGIYYLQQVVERITGEPLDLYAKRTLFGPLGLRHAAFSWTNELDPLIAAGHDSSGAFLNKTRYTHPNAAYTLYISAEDYASFVLEILNPVRTGTQSLARRYVDTMLTRQVEVTSREPIERPGTGRATGVYWGLGWSINATAQGDIYHHSGSNRSGFRCFSQFNPRTGSGIVIMCNGTGGGDLWTRLISRIGNL
jgi:CubicO group peptidase (beta-lactamase class C family)